MNILVPALAKPPTGPLTREAAQAQLQGAAMAREMRDGLDAAQRILVPPRRVKTAFFAKLTAATPVDGEDNQWTYSGQACVLLADRTVELIEDEFGTFDNAVNIRELRNTATVVDGSPLPAGASIGPVGSTWTGSAWTTEGLAGYVFVQAEYLEDGEGVFLFSEPNPASCEPAEEE